MEHPLLTALRMPGTTVRVVFAVGAVAGSLWIGAQVTPNDAPAAFAPTAPLEENTEHSRTQHSSDSAFAPTRYVGIPMGQLEGRHYIVQIESTKVGTLYTVRNTEGKMLAEQLTKDQANACFPELYLEGLIAGSRESMGVMQWAGVEH